MELHHGHFILRGRIPNRETRQRLVVLCCQLLPRVSFRDVESVCALLGVPKLSTEDSSEIAEFINSI